MNAILFELYVENAIFLLYALFGLTAIIGSFVTKILVKKFKLNLPKYVYFLLISIFLVGLIMRIFIMPKIHLMYMDEPLYIDQAAHINIAHKPISCTYTAVGKEECWSLNAKAPGWPFLLSLLFLVTGVSESAAFYLCAILGSLCIILLFFAIYLIFENEKMALWGALLISLGPLYVKWSTTIETNIPSLFFILLCFLAFLSYLKEKKTLLLILSCLLWLCAIFIRYENVIFGFVLALAYVLLDKKSPKRINRFSVAKLSFFVIGTIFIIVVSHLYLMHGILSLINPLDFYFLNTLAFIKAISFNYWFIFFFLAGLISYVKKPESKFLFALLALMILFIFFLPLFLQDRFALLPGVFMIMLVVYGLEKMTLAAGVNARLFRLVMVVLIGLFLFFSLHSAATLAKTEYEEYILEMRASQQIKQSTPAHCYVISEIPVTVLFGSKIKGMRTETALIHSKEIQGAVSTGHCFFYVYDGYCTEDKLSSSRGARKRCAVFLEQFNLSKVMDFRSETMRYSLYKINPTRKS